ncbi:hypothetical protein [Winogradskyella sp. PG-2]|uniref:hypothetical protein n=1 Tax=Winogradskyella sp. PG-2 TaxID=754409 RepID=UPI000696A76C|nr:hypothetical protein [Winogradskyella sp. PG-2]
MKIKSFSITSCFCLLITVVNVVNGQGNNLTGSPYSLFGLGVDSNANTGRNSGMGQTGISLNSLTNINQYNPSAFASIEANRFVLDIGTYSELQNISSNDSDERRFVSNFSSVALGFNGNGKYGIGLILKPATDVGYALIGIRSNIEGSTEEFVTNVIGSGGINEIRLDYSRKISDNLNLGAKFSYLFGGIDEVESILTSNSALTISEENYYRGYKLGLGLNYNFLDNYNFGLILDFPVNLDGSRNSITIKNSNEAVSILDDITNESIDDFQLPLKLGFGFSRTLENLELAIDYTTNLWTATDQSDTIGDYVNQHIFGFGAQYTVNPRSLKYWKRIHFRAGINYNSGYLEVDDVNIDNYGASIGLGLPLGRKGGSYLNFSYSRGNRGSTDSILVEERFNTINFNISLSDIWFQKRKYN